MTRQNRTSPKRKTAPDGEEERKDRVLQTRVPKALYSDLVSRARRLRVPVSNLVRNILEDSTRMVGNILESGLEIAETLGRSADKKDLQSVLGWQPMIANREVACSRCAAMIQKGEQGFMSVGLPGGRAVVICEACKSKV